jgi:hypothetical protein
VDKTLDRRLEIGNDHFGLHVQAPSFLCAHRVNEHPSCATFRHSGPRSTVPHVCRRAPARPRPG